MLQTIRKQIRNLRRKLKGAEHVEYTFEPSHTVVADYAEFTGLSTMDIQERIRHHKRECMREWDETPGASYSEKAETFYAKSRNYIFDLLAGNTGALAVHSKLDSFEPRILAAIEAHSGTEFLEFGGGTGVMCEFVSGLGKQVTYLDIPGHVFDFASWRFRKHGFPIKTVLAQPGKLVIDRSYDVIFTDAVLEHLPEAVQESAVRTLVRHLQPGGLFVCLVDLAGASYDMPMHADVNIKRLHEIVMMEGLACGFGRDGFCSAWTRTDALTESN